MPKPVGWWWNPRAKRWEIRGKTATPLAYINESGLTSVTDNYIAEDYAVTSMASLTAANIISGILGTGTITNLNVGTLATLRTANIAGQASLGLANLAVLQVAGGATISYMKKATGTIALAAVGTMTTAVATVTGMGSVGIAVGDIVTFNPKAAVTGVLLGNAICPSINNVNITVLNPAIDSAGSLPAVGVDVFWTRSSL